MASADALSHLPSAGDALVGSAAREAAAAAASAPGAEILQLPQQQQQLQQSTSQLNRNRVQEHQRFLAQQLLAYSLPLRALVAATLLLVFVATRAIYLWGWIVMSTYSRKPSDELLRWWLIVMLLAPIVQCPLSSQQCPLKRFKALVTPVAVAIGAWVVWHSSTCCETNPELFGYAKLHLFYQSAVWLLSEGISCAFVPLIFWMHRTGLLETGPGRAFAARPGLIDEIEAVAFHPGSCPEIGGDEAQSPECAICVEAFQEGDTIKKTPCGHHFCEACLGTWLESYAKSCPLCREDLQRALDQLAEEGGRQAHGPQQPESIGRSDTWPAQLRRRGARAVRLFGRQGSR